MLLRSPYGSQGPWVKLAIPVLLRVDYIETSQSFPTIHFKQGNALSLPLKLWVRSQREVFPPKALSAVSNAGLSFHALIEVAK